MRSWILFFNLNRKLLLFGFLLTFFSSFGQTFFVSLFVPEVLRTFAISNAGFGTLYAAATLVSALCLPFLGRFIDTLDLRTYAWLAVAGLVLSLLLFSQATHLVWLVLGLWGMRLAGQGLMSHTAVTTMARYFDTARGKAISLATLGHSAGGASLPLLAAFSIQAMGWRYTLLAAALLTALLLPALIGYLLRREQTDPTAFRETAPPADASPEDPAETSSYKEIFGSKAFWAIAPGVLATPFLNTAIFFYQLPLGQSKGWSAEWVAGSFTGYALTSAACMLLAGQWTDRFSARQLFPYFLFPLLAASLLLIFVDSAWATPFFFILVGISSGVGNTVKSALQAELFGVHFLGRVRSLFSALMVLSTALGPAAFGLLLDAGLSFEMIFSITTIYLLLTIFWNFRMVPKVRRLRWYSYWKGH